MVDKNSTLYETLLIAAALVFISTLLLYAAMSGRSPVSGIGFAVFISVFPAVLTLLVVKLMHLSQTWWRVVLIYGIVFGATVLTQTVLRSIE